ncbi:MAG: ATP-binding cassette domain-containing protein [Solirubrobacterales bacterium]|nr:ATP-binding cassette domain-containing protein [Solirubrobacterales bacterium]
MAAIETEGLRRDFAGGIVAVDGVDLAVEEGEIYGFLGPNGAGKTTTVRMLVTLLRPTGGRATVAGYDVADQASDVRKSIGVALQEAALDPLMKGRELLQLQATLHGIRKARGDELADSLLDRVGLTKAADRRVGTYSGGMRRRLDLATALVHEPKVLFLDEPTTGLDPVSRQAVWQEVSDLNDEGTTVFLTTQYLEEADMLADRVGIISDGKLVAEGTPEALKAQVGKPHLELSLASADGVSVSSEGNDAEEDKAEEVLARFGKLLPPRDGKLLVEVAHGASDIAPVIRALDDSGLAVESLDLVEPSLDDVFVEKTGQHLEGDDDAVDGAAEPEPAAAE